MLPGAKGIVYSNVVNREHHGALVKVAAALALTASLEIVFVRLLVRWPWRNLIGLDDGVIVLSTIFSIVQVACMTTAVNKGFGTAPELLSSSSIFAVESLLCAGNFLYIFSLYLGKLSVALFFRRLSAFHSSWSNALAGLSGVFCITSVLVLAIQIGPRSWLYEATVANSVVDRWIVIEVLSSFFDVLTAIFPIYLVRDLQMQRGVKIQVVILFWLRLPLIVLSVLHVLTLSHELRGTNGQRIRSVGSQLYLQAEMAYNLCSATVPCLRLFLTAAQSGVLSLVPEIEIADSQMANAGSQSFTMSRSRAKRTYRDEDGIELTSGRPEYSTAEAVANRSTQASLASDSSERAIVVRQTVDVRYMPTGADGAMSQ